MAKPSEHALRRALDEASRPAIGCIRAKRTIASSQVEPLLAYLETHLFDRALDVSHLKAACDVRNNSVAIFFHIDVGEPPGAYIARHRLKTAARLLVSTTLPIWQIAAMVGYSGMPTFSRAFHRIHGIRPRAYRQRAQESGRAATGSAVDAADPRAADSREEAPCPA